MKKLPTTFKKGGWLHKQLQRNGNIAIYERTLNGERRHWEVIRVQVAKNSYTFPNGKEIEAGDESYPTDRMWGKYGFTFACLDKAIKKAEEL